MSAELRYRSTLWGGTEEWLTEVGAGTPLLLIPPLLEEMNRCRAILVGAARVLGEQGFAVTVPDLPGTGESPRRLADVRWDEWRGFVAALTAELRPAAVLSVRGGALLEPEAIPAWRLSPVDGVRITRDLIRARRAAGAKESAEAIDTAARAGRTEFAGYSMGANLYAGLADARVADAVARTVRLRGDAAASDRVIDAAPPWRTAEPRRDPELSAVLGEDIAAWAATCGA